MADAPPPRPPRRRPPAHDAAALLVDISDRFETVEAGVRAMSLAQEELARSLHGLKDRESENQAKLSRMSDEMKTNTSTLMGAIENQARTQRDALEAETVARKAKDEFLEKAIDDRIDTIVSKVKAELFKWVGEEFAGWLRTAVIGGGGLAIAWFYGRPHG